MNDIEPARRSGLATPSPAPLTGSDLRDWMALRRVSGGGVARMGAHWFDHGRPVPGYLADALAELCASKLVALAELDVWALQRATLTDPGAIRYQWLCRRHQTARRLPAAGSAGAATWLADHPYARKLVQSVWDLLAELEHSDYPPGAVGAVRRVLAQHQPTPAGRCRACRRWRLRRRRFPCIVWHQIRPAVTARVGLPRHGADRRR